MLQAKVLFWQHNFGLLTVHGIKKHKKNITCQNLGQFDKIINNPAPLQSCAYQIKYILLYKQLELLQPLGNILWIRTFIYL